MKTNSISSVLTSIIFLISIFSFSNSYSQENTENDQDNFKINIRFSESNKINLECKEGCAWEELSFKLTDKKNAQAIDEYGMTELTKVNQNRKTELSNFLFTIGISPKGITLISQEGTNWKHLTFPLPQDKSQWIDKLGMIE